jgi:hypothetical protein
VSARVWSHLAAGLLAALVAFGVAACRRRATQCSRPTDDATMAVLLTARALHHQADAFEAVGDYPAATRAIERVLALRIPASVQEADEVRADAWGRLAEIALASDDPDGALAHANTGLRDSRRESVLRARLHLVRGRALRALADRARTAGDTTTAQARQRDAIEAFETSIQVNQRVLRRALDAGSR